MKEEDLRQEAAQRINFDLDCAGSINHSEIAEKIIAPYLTGWASVEDVMSKIKHAQKVLELAEMQIKDDMTDKLATLGKQPLTTNGITFGYKSGARTYKFDNCEYITSLEAKLKAAKDISKTLAQQGQQAIADTTTGELIEPAQELYNKDTFTTKF